MAPTIPMHPKHHQKVRNVLLSIWIWIFASGVFDTNLCNICTSQGSVSLKSLSILYTLKTLSTSIPYTHILDLTCPHNLCTGFTHQHLLHPATPLTQCITCNLHTLSQSFGYTYQIPLDNDK